MFRQNFEAIGVAHKWEQLWFNKIIWFKLLYPVVQESTQYSTSQAFSLVDVKMPALFPWQDLPINSQIISYHVRSQALADSKFSGDQFLKSQWLLTHSWPFPPFITGRQSTAEEEVAASVSCLKAVALVGWAQATTRYQGSLKWAFCTMACYEITKALSSDSMHTH